MFGFIRNIFRSKAPEEQDDWNWLRDTTDSVGTVWVSGYPFKITNFSLSSTSSVGRCESLTQRDLQMLTHIMSKHIKAADQVRKDLKEEALEYEVGDDLRNILFGEHREVKAYLKKLAALQHRLKHKIKVGG